MNGSRFGSAVVHRNPNEQILRSGFGILDEHIEVAVVLEHAGVKQLILELVARPASTRFHKIAIREFALRVLVEVLHVGVRGCTVEIEVIFLHVLAVIALAVCETEQPLLQDRIAAVPQCDCEAKLLLVIRDSREAVLSPAVSARTRLVVSEIVPGIAILAVIFTYRAPLPFTKIGTPFLPGDAALTRFIQTSLLCALQLPCMRFLFQFCHCDLLLPAGAADSRPNSQPFHYPEGIFIAMSERGQQLVAAGPRSERSGGSGSPRAS